MELQNTTRIPSSHNLSTQKAFCSELRKEQVRMVLQQLPIAYLADVVAGAFLCLILFFSSANWLTFLWYGILVTSVLVRFILLKRYQKNNSVEKQYNFLVVAFLIGGSIWGLTPLVWVASPSFLDIALVALWISGMLAGAAATISVIKKLFFYFAIPSSVLFVFFTFLKVEENTYLYIAAYIMYLGFIIPISARISKDLNKGIKLQIENALLQDQLMKDSLQLKAREEEFFLQKKMERSNTKNQQAQHSIEDERLLLLDSVNEGIFGINTKGYVSFINSSALRLLGYKEEEVLGHHALTLINPKGVELDQNSKLNLAFTNCFRDGRSLQNIDNYFYDAENKVIPVRLSCRPVNKKSEIIGTVVSFTDLTKQREMESLLLQSQKMEAMGRLAGGVAHDFNNLLTVIMGNLQFLEPHFASDEKAFHLFHKIMNAAKSGAELNNRLLSFSREQAIVTEPIDINEMLKEMHEFLDRILGEEITLTIRNHEKKCVTLTDRIQLENAILNLCINARDAMPSGGSLTLITRNTSASESYQENIEDSGFATLSVVDTGTGMSLDLQKKIFDPFFTTKGKHKGTGLGLSTVYGFLKQSGGNIIVNSRVGQGTKFTLFIPAANELLLRDEPVSEPQDQPSEKYQGTILVVEDNSDVQEVSAQILTQAGFSVILADDGPSGLTQFEAHPEIDLIFSDIIMPGGMTGIEMAEYILQKKPTMPILLATGYTENVLKNGIAGLNNIVCISKPYDINKLPRQIYSLMQEETV